MFHFYEIKKQYQIPILHKVVFNNSNVSNSTQHQNILNSSLKASYRATACKCVTANVS